MAKGWVKCKGCGEYVPLKDWPDKHICGTPSPKEVDLSKLTHRQMLDYFVEHQDQIEVGMQIIMSELPIFRGRVDLVGRDKDQTLCLIEIAHRSKCDRAFWIRKLHKYGDYLRQMGKQIYGIQDVPVRLLLKHSGKPTEDVTDSYRAPRASVPPNRE